MTSISGRRFLKEIIWVQFFLLSPMHARFILTGGFQLVFQQSLQKGSHFQSSHYSVLLFHSLLRGYWSVNCSEMRITWITLYPWSCICISTLIHDIAIHWTKNDKDVFVKRLSSTIVGMKALIIKLIKNM